MSLNNSTYTQSLGIPFTQYVTSSAGHALISSSTYFNDTSDNLPRYKDADGNVLVPFVSSSYAVTASHALNGNGLFTGSFSGSFQGDGSGLTGVEPFPFTGSAEITGSLGVTGSISSTALAGSDNRIVLADPQGTLDSSNQTLIEAYINPTSSAALLLDDTNNWTIYGAYTGSSITGTFQGQRHYNIDYFFEAVDDNDWIRLIRG